MNETSDEWDRRIVGALMDDGRMSVARIARRVERSRETVAYRLSRLFDARIVDRIAPIFDPRSFGFSSFLVLVDPSQLTSRSERRFIMRLRSEPLVSNVLLLEGPYHISFMLMARSNEELRDVLDRLGAIGLRDLSLLPIVRSTIRSPPELDSSLRITIGSASESVTISGNDEAIMRTLVEDGRAKVSVIADRTGIAASTVRRRLRALTDSSIRSFVPVIDFRAFGFDRAFLLIHLAAGVERETVREFFEQHARPWITYETVGHYDLCVELLITGDPELRALTERFRDRFTQGYVALDVLRLYQSYDRTWRPFETTGHEA